MQEDRALDISDPGLWPLEGREQGLVGSLAIL
jgi:hypothetical protein